MPAIGERRTTRTGRVAEWDGRGWREIVRGGGNDPTNPTGVQASAEQRGRVNITYDPALEAHRTLSNVEAIRRRRGDDPNVFNQEWGARALELVPFDGGAAARLAGGGAYQQYESANRAFESAMLPILSGAAVTESEARRMIRATLPQFGDTPETLRDKARRREQMLNGASRAIGAGVPFPAAAANRGVVPQQTRQAPAQPRQRAPQTQNNQQRRPAPSGVIRYDANGNRIP